MKIVGLYNHIYEMGIFFFYFKNLLDLAMLSWEVYCKLETENMMKG